MLTKVTDTGISDVGTDQQTTTHHGGVTGDHALNLLRESITEAMTTGKSKDKEIAARVKQVEKAVETVKRDLIAKLPKQKRAGRVITKDLEVEVLPVHELDDALAAA